MWKPAATLFSADPADFPMGVEGPTVALDGHGHATAVWHYSSAPRRESVIMEADWTAASGWTPARTLPAFGTDVASFPFPSLAVDTRGDAVIAWIAANGQLRVSYRPAGEAWQPPRTLSLPGDSASYPQVGIDDHGRSLVMWSAARSSSSGYLFSWKVAARGRSGVWGKPKVVCGCEGFGSLAMNASGLALVVWSPVTGGLWAKTRTPSGRWLRKQEISPAGTGLYYMPLALNSRGAAVVAWVEQPPPPAFSPQLTVAVRPAHGRFGRPQTIGGDAYWGFAVALAQTGAAVVMWENDSSCCLFAVSRAPGANSFASQQTLAPGGGQTVPQALTMDARGNTLALWTRSDETNGHLYLHAAQRPAGGSFDTGSDIGDIGEDSYKHAACRGEPSLATTPNRNLAIAVWPTRPHPNAVCTAVQAATFTP